MTSQEQHRPGIRSYGIYGLKRVCKTWLTEKYPMQDLAVLLQFEAVTMFDGIKNALFRLLDTETGGKAGPDAVLRKQ